SLQGITESFSEIYHRKAKITTIFLPTVSHGSLCATAVLIAMVFLFHTIGKRSPPYFLLKIFNLLIKCFLQFIYFLLSRFSPFSALFFMSFFYYMFLDCM